MGRALYTNNATATLSSGISAVATTITLNSGLGALFPNPTGGDYFYGTLTDAATGTLIEIVKVTARSTDSMTVERGQQGTTAQAYNANDKFELRVTASGFGELATLTGTETVQNKTIDSSNSVAAAAISGTVAAASTATTATTATTANTVASSAFASASENAAGTIENKPVDPLGIREALNATGTAPVYACRAWVNFNGTGSPITIYGSGNVSSITDNGVGEYTVNFTTSMPDANYCGQYTASDSLNSAIMGGLQSNTAGSAKVNATTRIDSAGRIDVAFVSVAIFR